MKPRIASLLLWLAVVCGFVGFVDATYLTANHFAGTRPPCTIGGGKCSSVLESDYARIGSVPLSLLGMLYYAGAVLSCVACIDKPYKRGRFKLMLVLSWVGVAVSGHLVYLQLGPLKTICDYCMLSALMTVGYAAAAIWTVLLSSSDRSAGVVNR